MSLVYIKEGLYQFLAPVHAPIWLKILVRAECVRQRNEVAIKLGIIFLSLSLSSRRLLKTIEGGVVGF